MKRLLITLSLLASVLPCPAIEPGSIDHSRLLVPSRFVRHPNNRSRHPSTGPSDGGKL
ncbi:MAG: hypothetical protein CM1200mP29_17100 [Verrucomicrobiota bacterium]|nr:MAG: hypothetical protein CM1200mP29_17100 [Verrucomicrobiota bacterium]